MNSLKRIIATALVATSLIAGMAGCKKSENEGKSYSAKTKQIQEEDRLRETILGYLSQPKFSNSDFMEQISGTKAELQMLDQIEGMVYLSIPSGHFSEDILSELTSDPNAVEFGKTLDGQFEGSRVELGDYILMKHGNYLLRFPSNNFKVDPSDTINIHYRSANYSLSMGELQDFLENSSIYRGFLNAYIGMDGHGVHRIIANHGAFVAKKGERSLERLVATITKNENSKEGIAQKLLDFVTTDLKNDPSDIISNAEVLKRPNEVLMTGGSDCSGKVILYASLLEQTNVDYRLVYSIVNKHITVAVEGNYGNINGLSFNWDDKTFSVAETTATGFQIGISRLKKTLRIENINYIQKPGENSEIYDAHTREALPFL